MIKVYSARHVPHERREGIDISTAGAAADRAARRLTLASWLAPSVPLDKTYSGATKAWRATFVDGARMAAEGARTGDPIRKGHGLDMIADAYTRRDAAWAYFEAEYLQEVRGRYVKDRPAHEALIRGEEPDVQRVLCCCRDSRYCHRYIVRTRILTGLGCVDGGERGDEFYTWGNR